MTEPQVSSNAAGPAPVSLLIYHAATGPQRAERAAQAQRAGAFGEAVLPGELMALVRDALKAA